MAVHVFVGPTLPATAVSAARPDAIVHPPVRHGDLLRLAPGRDDTVVLVDGYYHQVGAVRHKEILSVLAAGVRVVGCASMGALRAAELHPFGMIGYGTVFEQYRNGVLDRDDEVAVAHGEGPDYRSFSIPMVTMRWATAAARRAGALTTLAADTVLAEAQLLPYHERSWQALSVRPGLGELCAALRSFLARHPEYADVKAADAKGALRVLDRLVSRVDARWVGWAQRVDWRSRHVRCWQAEFDATLVEGRHVGTGEVARYRQIYGDSTPKAWRRHVLARIAGLANDVSADRLLESALDRAARYGVSTESLTEDQRQRWLTVAERAGLSELQALLTVLTRSYRPTLGPLPELVEALDVRSSDAGWQTVAECQAVNDEVASWGPGQSIGQLRDEVLREHLAHVWGTGPGDELLAAARDRGFSDLDEAVRMARPFFLRYHFGALTWDGVK